MKPTDLMVDDWVKWKDKYVQIATISGIVYSFGHIDVEIAHCGSGFVERHDLKSISPIPLTSEILERNGFETTPSSWEMEINDIVIVIVKIQDEYLLSISEPYCDGITKGYKWTFHDLTISYVHQLQHAFRVCGLTELADNFKIELFY